MYSFHKTGPIQLYTLLRTGPDSEHEKENNRNHICIVDISQIVHDFGYRFCDLSNDI